MNIKDVSKSDLDLVTKIKPSLSKKIFLDRLYNQELGLADFILLEDVNKPIGIVFLKWKGKNTHPEYPDIEDLYIRKEFRGQGYGTLLLKECEARARKKGFQIIGLAVNLKENPSATELYRKLGYKHDSKKSYVDGIYDGKEDWVLDFEKMLD